MYRCIFFCTLSITCFVPQIRAYKWNDKKALIDGLGQHYFNLKGLNITSDDYDEEERTVICKLGGENKAMMYTNAAIVITGHENTSIKIVLPGIAEVQGVKPNITVDMTVFACATNENVSKTFFFGQGPYQHSIAVYAKKTNEEFAECVGMFTEVTEW